MSNENKKKIDELVKSYQETVDFLNAAKEKDEQSQNEAINAAVSSLICCKACQAVSGVCVPDQTPSKCQGGCTITSYVF